MICKITLQEVHRDHDHALAAEHNHPSNRGCPLCFRALLCLKCNSVLGFADDNIKILIAAAKYLERWKRQNERAGAGERSAPSSTLSVAPHDLTGRAVLDEPSSSPSTPRTGDTGAEPVQAGDTGTGGAE